MATIITDQHVQPTDEDTIIVSAILKGEKQLYEQLLRKYNQRLFRIGMPILNNDMEVEEVMQIAYIKAYENLHQFEGKAAFATWLTRIFLNECFAFQKKKKKLIEMKDTNTFNEMGLSQKVSAPDATLINKELGRVLENAIINLPEKYRVVFVLRELEDLSIDETVNILGITNSNVKVRLNRAKAMLRNSLSAYYKADSVFHFHLDKCNRIVGNVLAHLGISGTA